MESIFRQEFTVSQGDTDAFGRMKPSAILAYMQEVAGRHFSNPSEYPELCWVVSRHHVVIRRLPKAEEKITLETWAIPATRVAFPRGTIAYDEKGEELFRSVSLWVLINTASRAMVLPGKVNLPMVTNLRGLELPTPGSLPAKIYGNTQNRIVRYSMLDVNGHMNNAKYLDMIEDLLPVDFHKEAGIREFTVCYISEATAGQAIDLTYELSGGTLRVDARSGEVRVFSAQADYAPV